MANVEARVVLLQNMAFQGYAPSGHTVILDSSEEFGGQDLGPRPLELLLLGLGGCTGMDVISILRKKRQKVTSYEVRLQASRSEAHPRVYTDITVEHVVRGVGVTEEAVRRAVELSSTKYCPASAMLGQSTRIQHCVRVRQDDAEEVGVE